jgi:chemotaxis protein CheD
MSSRGMAGARPRAPSPPSALAHFAHIRRYWDARQNAYIAKLLPGDYYVTLGSEVICTTLGSCVSACVRDRATGIGGMNHFMLPLDRSRGDSAWSDSVSAATRYGANAMEHLITDMLKAGVRRENFEFKLVGGGRVLEAMTDVGAANIEFARTYMRTEGFTVTGEDLGDCYPRQVIYTPSTGRLRVKRLRSTQLGTVVDSERSYLDKVSAQPLAGDVELF